MHAHKVPPFLKSATTNTSRTPQECCPTYKIMSCTLNITPTTSDSHELWWRMCPGLMGTCTCAGAWAHKCPAPPHRSWHSRASRCHTTSPGPTWCSTSCSYKGSVGRWHLHLMLHRLQGMQCIQVHAMHTGPCDAYRSMWCIQVHAMHTGPCDAYRSMRCIQVHAMHTGPCNAYRSRQRRAGVALRDSPSGVSSGAHVCLMNALSIRVHWMI